METLQNAYRTDPPASLEDDVLLERIHTYRLERQEMNSVEYEIPRMRMESALAELEAEALTRGLPRGLR